jgi:hypothetical protein
MSDEKDDDLCANCEHEDGEYKTDIGMLCGWCLSEVINGLQAELTAAREREAKLRAAWPGRKDYANEAGVLLRFDSNAGTGWVLSGIKGWWPDADAAINAVAGIEEPRT